MYIIMNIGFGHPLISELILAHKAHFRAIQDEHTLNVIMTSRSIRNANVRVNEPYPYPAKAGSATAAGRRRVRLAPPGIAPAVSWS